MSGERHNLEELTFYRNKPRLWARVVAYWALVSIHLFNLSRSLSGARLSTWDPWDMLVTGAVSIVLVLFGFFVWRMIRMALDDEPALTLNRQGVWINNLQSQVDAIPWEDIQGFDQAGSFRATLFIQVLVKDLDSYVNEGTVWERWSNQAGRAFFRLHPLSLTIKPNEMGLDDYKMLLTLNKYHEHYTGGEEE